VEEGVGVGTQGVMFPCAKIKGYFVKQKRRSLNRLTIGTVFVDFGQNAGSNHSTSLYLNNFEFLVFGQFHLSCRHTVSFTTGEVFLIVVEFLRFLIGWHPAKISDCKTV
jgi:hypothetical protein